MNILNKMRIANQLKRKFSKLNKLDYIFDYGQNSTLRIRMPKAQIQADVETLWVDQTEVELFLNPEETESDNTLFVNDQGKNIFVKETDEGKRTRKMNLRIPEYSSLDFECRGKVIQKDTNIDAKMKGNLRIISDDMNPESLFEFRRVKTEEGEIRLKNSNLTFKSYWETKNGILVKDGKGRIEMKRLGVSYDLETVLKDCYFDVKTTFTNPIEEIGQHRIAMKGDNSVVHFGIFRGSINAELNNSTFEINEGNFDGVKIKGKDCHIEIYFNEINAPCEFEFENCEVNFRVSPLIKEKFLNKDYVQINQQHSNVKIGYEEYKSNLFNYLMRKYNVDPK